MKDAVTLKRPMPVVIEKWVPSGSVEYGSRFAGVATDMSLKDHKLTFWSENENGVRFMVTLEIPQSSDFSG